MEPGKSFKDNFSKQAAVYSKFRPMYPRELFEFLGSLTTEHRLAWDCGTGNGQSAVQLAGFFERVYATDPSAEQISNSFAHEKITFRVENAEAPTGLDDNSVDLVTVTQAVHWFDFDLFYAQVRRVLKPEGILAVWAYGIPAVNSELDAIIRDFHDNVVGEFWLEENRLIDYEYATIPFPFEEIKVPEFFIRKQATLEEALGHFRSWSATQKYIDRYAQDPISSLRERLQEYWGDTATEKEITWKLIVRVGKAGS